MTPHSDHRRLLLIVPWFTMGGADLFNLNLTRRLTSYGWAVTLVATRAHDHPWLPEFSALTPDVFALGRDFQPNQLPQFLRDVIQKQRPGVVLLTNSEPAYLLLPYLRAFCPEPLYLDYAHMEEEHWAAGGYPAYTAGLQGLLDLNLVSSHHLKDWMIGRGAHPDRIEVCTINIDTARWHPDESLRRQARAHYGIDDGTPAIVFSGRLCPQKQPRVLVRVLHELASRGRSFRALIAGDGEDRPWVEQFIREHALEAQVTLYGALPNNQVRELLAAGDLFFLPSRMEGISLAIYEAMAMGLAIVAADVGGQRELVTPECGRLVHPATEEREVNDYTQELSNLLGNSSLLRHLGLAGLERVRTGYGLDRLYERLTALFEQAATLRLASPRAPVTPAFGEACIPLALRRIDYRGPRNFGEVDFRLAAAPDGQRPQPSTATEQAYLDFLAAQEMAALSTRPSWRLYRRLCALFGPAATRPDPTAYYRLMTLIRKLPLGHLFRYWAHRARPR